MINLYNQVPSIYPSASRDFQYLCWLINIVLNDVKHNVDSLYALPNNKADPRLTELLAMTLGFKVKRNYDQKQLAALVSIIPRLLKYKGTELAVRMAGEALITASGTTGTFDCDVKGNMLEVLLPKSLIDVNLFIDLLPYILPAGMTFRIVRKTQEKGQYTTYYDYSSILHAESYNDARWDSDTQSITGLAGLFNVNSETDIPKFTNFKKEPDEFNNKHTLNAGLMENTVIPVLDSALGAFRTPEQVVKTEEEENNI